MEVEQVFVAHEIDLDYEFDAVWFFDFTREETRAEAHEAELWFESAKSYPPSPFVAKLFLREDVLPENVNTSPKSKSVENMDADSDIGMDGEFSLMDVTNRDCERMDGGLFTDTQSSNPQKVQNHPLLINTGLSFYSHISRDKPKAKANSFVKSSFPRTSTLMKPTASQLAKQNRAPQVGGSRFQKLVQNSERSLCNSSTVESQATKRQKLEGGHLYKVTDTKQQINLVHKQPRKDETIGKISSRAQLKLTIPREPDLETAHRAERTRPKNGTELEHVKSAARRFKARPLNRKILDAPSMPLPKKSTPRLPEFHTFHLKTSERAMQHTNAVSSSSLHCKDSEVLDKPSTNAESENRELSRPSTMDTRKHDGCDMMQNFKAHPLNRKIFSSKGDIGVFRNSKRETTIPMEFNFHTEKRMQHNPPTELFSKLSLTSELRPNNGSQLKLPRPTHISIKGSKENRSNPFQPEQKITELVKNKPFMFGGEQIQGGSNGWIAEVGIQQNIRRSLGLR